MARTGGESGRGKAKDWLAVADAGALRPPASYTELVEAGFERAAESRTVEAPGRCLTAVNELLVQHGWDPEVAAAVIAHVIEYARPNPDGGRPRAHGWREMSAELGIPPWQARRVTVLLLGAGGWPGLVERVAVSGPRALREPAVIAAVQATCDSTLRPPARAATNISARTVRQIALAS
jgi:hypothetical protein